MLNSEAKRHRETDEPIAVIGGGPNSNELVVKHVLVALVDKLMSASNKIQAVDSDKLSRDLASKQPASAAGRNLPCLYIFGIGPHQIAECSFVRNLLISI
jgi:hypothetical protein